MPIPIPLLLGAIGLFAVKKMSGSGYGSVTRGRMQEIQTMLLANGYSLGKADGKYGPKTKAAVLAFQKDHMPKSDGWDGKPGSKTQAALEQVEAERVRGAKQVSEPKPQPASAECDPSLMRTWDLENGGICLAVSHGQRKKVYPGSWLPKNMLVSLPDEILLNNLVRVWWYHTPSIEADVAPRKGWSLWGNGGRRKAFGDPLISVYLFAAGAERDGFAELYSNDWSHYIQAVKSVAIMNPGITFLASWGAVGRHEGSNLLGYIRVQKSGTIYDTDKYYNIKRHPRFNIIGQRQVLIESLESVIQLNE